MGPQKGDGRVVLEGVVGVSWGRGRGREGCGGGF